MLTNDIKTNTLWKNYKGWGSTHSEREVFEELYRAYNKVSSNAVLTYGNLLPKIKTDEFYSDVKSLTSTNDTLYYEESNFKKVPLIKKYTDLKLTAISSNCNHAFAILDEKGNQIENIIPYDYSDTGLYNITLKTQEGIEVAWGNYDWLVDTNSSLLTFNNGIPEGISSTTPPLLTFYQYAGPVGERHYIDATLFDIENVEFPSYKPVKEFTSQVSNFLDNVEEKFFSKYKFNGTDTTQGIGLQYEILSNVVETSSNDPIKGYDDNSNAQVVSVLSHKTGTAENLDVQFVSEGIQDGNYVVSVTEAEHSNVVKIDIDDGFFVVAGEPGTYTITVSESNKIYAALLVKDNKTQAFELFYPREDLKLTIKLPTFVDLIKLPPHLKFTSLNSYTDHITPQYYGPRVADFVIAADETTESSRSADFVVYNKTNFYLSDAFAATTAPHIFIRNGEYKNSSATFVIDNAKTISGETTNDTIISNSTIQITSENCLIENITFKKCSITASSLSCFKNCKFEDSTVSVDEDSKTSSVTFENCSIEDVAVGNQAQFFNSYVVNATIRGEASFFSTSISNKCDLDRGKVNIYSSYIKEFDVNQGEFFVNSSHIGTLNVLEAEKTSVLGTTNIDYVEALPETIKIDSSYVTKFADTIKKSVYPGNNTVPFYNSFENRVYATLPAPFGYDEETNELQLKLDSIKYTLFINEKGELQSRFSSSTEITLENVANFKTQIEDRYNEHADTTLSTDKPANLDEALIDLYWSKADLKNGKVPIDQLPDSVAYGGLQFVGMWSFEDSLGKYPTFENCDMSFASDDDYTALQNGWFFIVSASKMEDDPVYPQTAEDNEVWTAGDWIIYSSGKWTKLDRSYSDPVYSRLPELAVKTGAENSQWSIEDGGTGLLQLSYKSLAEAIRLINDELLKLSPDRPASVQEIGFTVDEENTTASKQKYFEVGNGLQLNQITQLEPSECWNGNNKKKVYFKQIGFEGSELPLEQVFYCGEKSNITVYDEASDISENCDITRFDPYQKYRLGFRTPTVMKAAEVSGYINLGQGTFNIDHDIHVSQYQLQKSAFVTDDTSTLEGDSTHLSIKERLFYKFDDYTINQCKSDTVNLRALNTVLAANRNGGYGCLLPETKVTGTFIITNFTKYGTVSTDAKVELKALYGEETECPVEITSQLLKLTNADEQVYDLSVEFVVTLPNVVYDKQDLTVKAQATNFEVSSLWTNVLVLKDVMIFDTTQVPEIVESAGNVIYPSLGATWTSQFGGIYSSKNYSQVYSYPEVVYGKDGYGWPDEVAYVANFGIFENNTYNAVERNGTQIGNKLYRFVTFKKEFSEIKDLCGFNVNIDWGTRLPEINALSGTYEDVKLQVCVRSTESKNETLLDGNKAVPVFFEAELTQGEACNYPGKSDANNRRITFGRKPIPIQTIYVRIGIPYGTNLHVKDVTITTD